MIDELEMFFLTASRVRKAAHRHYHFDQSHVSPPGLACRPILMGLIRMEQAETGRVKRAPGTISQF
ncbi:hypothetical protein [Methyloferula stellata]|uniref:hypothetical protein n=1 Tax=Methyloferula stellata TaxID=876270 RepID=UPI00137631D2|nr:hypothetical protein [Methyloferula stellata]